MAHSAVGARRSSGRGSLERLILRTVVLVAVFCASVVGSGLSSHASMPPAGSIIANQAVATYVDSATGLSSTLYSNRVEVQVQPREALSLTADRSILGGSPGVGVSLPHRLTNTGNVQTVYEITFGNLPGDDYDLASLTLTRDLNENGIADTTEPEIANGGMVTLLPGAWVDVVLHGFVPGTAGSGQLARMTITATSTVEGATATNTDTVTTTTGAAIRILKSASTTQPGIGDLVSFAISASNTGSSMAAAVPVTVDGSPANLVVIRDVIPVNTVFASIDSAGSGTPLYHRAGDPLHAYTTTVPSPLSSIDTVAAGYLSIPQNVTVSLSFSVVIGPNASGAIPNTAQIFYDDGVSPRTADSNTVVLNLAFLAPEIHYYDNSFSRIAAVTSVGTPLYVQAHASACNVDSSNVETRSIQIASSLTGDTETFPAVETGPNTGIFRITNSGSYVPTRDSQIFPVTSGNGIIETTQNDVLTATLEGCGSATASATILIDPFGVVFESRSNAPVAGAVVTLIDVTGSGNGGNAGGPAFVLMADGVTPAPATVTTGVNGRFHFPLVLPSTYRLAVTPPNGHSFPSLLPPILLPAGRAIDPSGSYGNNFVVSAAIGAFRVDVPLDTSSLSGLFIEKYAPRTVVEVGDVLDYTIRVKNSSGRTLTGIEVTDTLPAGFSYLRGSARLNGARISDPAGGPGPELIFSIGDLADSATAEIVIRVKIGPGALEGTGINRAVATGSGGVVSNTAYWKVKVVGGVFSEKAYIIGKVFADCNRNRIQDEDEVGIPGVRIYLEDGTYIITDNEGKYSFYGISPRTHVLRLDRASMPPGSQLQIMNNRDAGTPGTRFVDLKKGELHKADFAEDLCSAGVMAEVASRRAESELFSDETERRTATRLSTQPEAAPADPRSLPASGVVESMTKASSFKPVFEKPQGGQDELLPAEPLTTAASFDFDKRLPEMEPTLDFVDLREGDVLPYSQSNIVVKGPEGGRFGLTVNNAEIPESKVGRKATMSGKGIEAWEYVGIDLLPGANSLMLSQIDHFGNQRGTRAITVTAPGRMAEITVSGPQREMTADGRTPAAVRVSLADEEGIPVTVRTPVTLQASAGAWQVKDLDEAEPGVQVFIEGGQAEFLLIPPQTPGEVTVTATSGMLGSREKLYFAPELRPMIAAGIVEGVINFRRFDPGKLFPVREEDAFEEEIRSNSFSSDDGRISGGGRAAFFLKGKVKGDYLLTMAYDSDKDTQERMFRDIQPDAFYPVYGDSSVRGYDAQATSKFYVRIDKNRSYLMYGDFTTQTATDAKKLSVYSRSMTGVKGHYENRSVSVTGFASRDTNRQVIEELPAKGISGPYYLSQTGFVENSEKVEIVTRDRSQPSVIIKAVPQTRFQDYEIDPLSGFLLFRAPVASVDENMDLNFIRVTYEIDQGGDQFWVAGIDAQAKITESVEVGGTYVKDENPQDRTELVGANVTVKLGERSYLIGEWAQSDRQSTGRGDAERIELRHDSETLQARIYAERTDERFSNPSAGVASGRLEVNAKVMYRMTPKTLLRVEGLVSEDLANHGRREGVLINVEQSFYQFLRVEAGMRYVKETLNPAQDGSIGITPFEYTTARVKLSGQVPALPQLGLFGEYEQALNGGDRRMAAAGGEYRISDLARIYARHEFLSGLLTPFALSSSQQRNATVIGIDSKYLKEGAMFSEYRIRDSISGRDAEAAIGLRNAWTLAEGLRLNASFERTQTLGLNSGSNDATAITGALEYTASPFWKGTLRLEGRTSRQSDTLLHTLGVAYKYSKALTLLGRYAIDVTKGKEGTSDRLQARLQVGAALRPVDSNVWNLLAKYEYRHEKEGSYVGAGSRRNVNILSLHLNYQPRASLVLSGRYAGKLLYETSGGISSTSSAHLLSFRTLYNIAEKWDVGFLTSALFSGLVRSLQYGVGAEVGYNAAKNLWVSAGYNVTGFQDDDLSSGEYTNRGPYVRLRYKFDEDLLPLFVKGDAQGASPAGKQIEKNEEEAAALERQ